MKVELVPCYTYKALFLRLAKDYIETLKRYDKRIVWDEKSVSGWLWNSWFILEDRTIQGFVTTEEVDFKIYRGLLYISEFYVVPESRRRGVGLAAVKALMESWRGDVFLYVLHGNFAAALFWEIVSNRLGWKRIERPGIREEEGCELLVFQTQ